MSEKEIEEYKERISEECLETILDNHQHWLNEDCVGWENMRANLSGANLHNADLSHTDLHNADLSYTNLCYADLYNVNLRDAYLSRAKLSGTDLRGTNLCNADLSYTSLCNADLSYTNLHNANLSGADLRGAYLLNANLSGANLRGADLYNVNLRDAYLYNANLSGADLRNADLRKADLSKADLCGANLSGANLNRANLSGAKNVPYIPMVCPEEGDFTGWKKAEGNKNTVIVKLHIPSDAKRSSATTRKCRCDKAEVIAIYNLDGAEAEETTCHSDYDNSFIYEVGKTVEVTDFNEDRWNECAKGIHFFINRQEAINY